MFAMLHGKNEFYVHKIIKKKDKEIMLALLLHLIVPKWQPPVPRKCLVKMEIRWIMEFGVVCSFKASIDDPGMHLPRVREGYCLPFPKCTSS